jgi:hypothetical protein
MNPALMRLEIATTEDKCRKSKALQRCRPLSAGKETVSQFLPVTTGHFMLKNIAE